ncbi:MAG TPA: hypothetical protein H9902_16170 [Candidatus Stackebrandtia faecavium]|nr:hypothetical protein [Candidatus Stackebrandtia faecavium]
MTSLDEFIHHTNTDKTQVNDAASSIERTKDLAEQIQSRFELLAADTMTAGAQQLRTLTEDAIALLNRFEEDSSPEAIRKFANAMAANYANAQPPLKPFVIEGVIRAFAGEEHILDEISAEDQRDSQFPIIREIVAGSGELQARIDDVLTDAETLAREWEAEEG